MNAPLLWIGVPLACAALFWLRSRRRGLAFGGGALTLLLTLAALWLPLDVPLQAGSLAFRIQPEFQILGRRFILTSADQFLLVLLYGAVSLWFWAAEAAGWANRLIPYGLAFSALCVAALAVEPFLYAALLFEIAALLSVPLLVDENTPRHRGVWRFLILQTLAVPFILLAGWLLSGLEAGPAGLQTARQATLALALGFALLLAAFPFYHWLPMMAEESHPYAVSFLFWIFPTVTTVFGLEFLDRYTWLREAAQLTLALRVSGLLLLVIGGTFAAFERHLGRVLGFAMVAENGLSLLTLSLGLKDGVVFFFLLLPPRLVAVALWGLSLALLQKAAPSLTFEAVKGKARSWPLAASGLVIAMLTLSGMPLLAMFPPRQAIWSMLARQSSAAAIGFLAGTLGLVLASMRSLATLVAAPADARWEVSESVPQRFFLAAACLMLFAGGLFPRWVSWVLPRVPLLFEHLGR
jgi:NADH-quinone oxidoreductase subunit N